jgi:hypothetical protein
VDARLYVIEPKGTERIGDGVAPKVNDMYVRATERTLGETVKDDTDDRGGRLRIGAH